MESFGLSREELGLVATKQFERALQEVGDSDRAYSMAMGRAIIDMIAANNAKLQADIEQAISRRG